jgi:Uncharacterized protein conserved in bacteria
MSGRFICRTFFNIKAKKMEGKIARLSATEKALEVIRELENKYGALMFYQAGGCCEGTQPQCFEKGGFFPRMNDAMIGTIHGYEFWIDRDLFEYWKYSHFTLDVAEGFGPGGFSLETPLGKTFKVQYRLFTPEEYENLEPVLRSE